MYPTLSFSPLQWRQRVVLCGKVHKKAELMKILSTGKSNEIVLTGKSRERAAYFLNNPTFVSVPPKYAATVMLIGEGDHRKKEECAKPLEANLFSKNPFEVFMLQRVSTMAFAPNAVVFPGGRVDARDTDPRLPWVDSPFIQTARQQGLSEEVIRGVVVAAARELFEECGVVLAGYNETHVVDVQENPLGNEIRKALTEHELSFAEALIAHNLILRSDLLTLCSRWVTPKFEPRRYDTFFFVAHLPKGQCPDAHTSEARSASWVNPSLALKEAAEGNLLLLPPTRCNLSVLARLKEGDEIANIGASLEPTMLVPSFNEGGDLVLR